MATLFQAWKKNLYTMFVKKNKPPNFSTKAYVKLRPFWDEFVQYKTSKESEATIRRNKENTIKNKYPHYLGSGGYMSAIPKWERIEREMIARGVVPQTIWENWGERSKQWLYGHGGTIDPLTRLLDWGQEISRAAEMLVHARADVASGLFKPNREKDELTYALKIPEHGGRTRGYGAVLWYHSFLADQGTYRSRQRNKEEEAERIHKLEEFVHI